VTGAEAAFMLVVARVLLRTIALPRWSALLGQPTNTNGLDVNGSPAQGNEGVVALGIARAAHRFPGTYTCLERASAGQFMLRLRGIPGAVVIGLKPDGNGDGHAWLVGKTGVLTGRADQDESVFTPVSAFRRM
jgi:hypothetical protein